MEVLTAITVSVIAFGVAYIIKKKCCAPLLTEKDLEIMAKYFADSMDY